jgi:hypothetical protein
LQALAELSICSNFGRFLEVSQNSVNWKFQSQNLTYCKIFKNVLKLNCMAKECPICGKKSIWVRRYKKASLQKICRKANFSLHQMY